MTGFLEFVRVQWRVVPAPTRWVWCIAGIITGAIAYDLMRMPIQVSDAIHEILSSYHSSSAWASFMDILNNEAYLRPMRLAQIKAIFDLSGGHYSLAYRGFHVLLLFACMFLFVRALRVRDWTGFVAGLFALTVLIGGHTFRWFVKEAYPINHFLEVAVFCLFTFHLGQSRGGWWIDGLAAITFVVASLTLESGLLVWVVAAASWLTGRRGISTRGLGILTLLLAAYVILRFAILSTGLPGLEERSAGYFLTRLDPPQLQEQFGANPAVFYGYNVLASILSVLLAEPQGGILNGARAWLVDGVVPLHIIIGIVTSSLTSTFMLLAFVRAARRRAFDDISRAGFVFGIVLLASAAMSYAYTKDEIMTTAGVFYALAAYAVVYDLLKRTGQMSLRSVGIVSLVLAVTASGWAIRSAGLHQILRAQAFKQRNDWARVPALWKQDGIWPEDPGEQRILERLRTDALELQVPNPHFEPRWMPQVFGD